MTNNKEMVFDSNCGISEEEQREIFVQINNIAEKNRLSLAGTGKENEKQGKKKRFKAKKSGAFFPVLVNISAIAVLAGCLYALYIFQGKTNIQVREGAKVYNTAERALILEIRNETFSRLKAKENEISQISSQLEGIDAELHELYSSNQELTAEQRAAESRLRALQEEYRASMGNLQDERSRILEEARIREANLQAQLESRTSELALVSEQSALALDLALDEMDRISREQAQAATVEAQMGAFFANLNSAINEYRLEDAAGIVKTMRDFLNTPAFQSLRSIQARRELYAQAINSFETMIEEARRYQAALSSGVISPDKDTEKAIIDLQERNARLEQDIAEKDKSLAAFSSEGSGMVQRLNELEGSVSALRTVNSALEANSAEKDTRIGTLETEGATLRQTLNRQEAAISNRDQCLSQIQNVIQGKAIANMTIGELGESLVRIQEALQNL